MVIYICWNLWKERNRRIFNNAFQSPSEVAARVKEDIDQRRRALRIIGPPPHHVFVFLVLPL
jgi:uncharacterized Fe-S cluster-containing radical SAM superfamily protein